MMVGCMLESSALIAAGAVIAQRTDYADLDGAWLLGDDPFPGWKFDHGACSSPRFTRPWRRGGERLVSLRIPCDYRTDLRESVLHSKPDGEGRQRPLKSLNDLTILVIIHPL